MKPVTPIVEGMDLEVTEIAKNQPEYFTLPAHVYAGTILTRWKLTLWERFKILFTGNLYYQQATFGRRMQPIKLSIHKDEVIDDLLYGKDERNELAT